GECATRVPVPDLFGQHVNETHPVVYRALVDRIRRQEAVQVSGTQVRHHVGRGHCADLNVTIRINAVFGQVVAQQVVVHGVVERNRQTEPFPVTRITLVLVLHGQRDRLPVDVFSRGHGPGNGLRPGAHRQGQRHGRQHVRSVVFTRQRLVAYDCPTGGLDHLDIQAVPAVIPQRVRHDDGRCTRNRNEAYFQLRLLQWSRRRCKGFTRRREREEAGYCREGRARTHCLQEIATQPVIREHRLHDGALHYPFFGRGSDGALA